MQFLEAPVAVFFPYYLLFVILYLRWNRQDAIPEKTILQRLQFKLEKKPPLFGARIISLFLSTGNHGNEIWVSSTSIFQSQFPYSLHPPCPPIEKRESVTLKCQEELREIDERYN